MGLYQEAPIKHATNDRSSAATSVDRTSDREAGDCALDAKVSARQRKQKRLRMVDWAKGLFRLGMKIFLGVTSDVSEGCRKEFLETNKKTNYIARQETARQIY